MRSTQRSESMHAFYGGYLHCKSGLVQFVHEYDNVLENKEQKELEDNAADSKGVIPCIGSTGIERQFQLKYTSNMFRTLQLERPSRVKSKGWPKSKRLGAELDKSIKKLLQKRKGKSHSDDVDLKSDNDHHGSVKKDLRILLYGIHRMVADSRTC
ncbi:hypothetical protein AHAS_Ahas04G0093300 [Arachis hypogaea]